jgi:hypothetical protein
MSEDDGPPPLVDADPKELVEPKAPPPTHVHEPVYQKPWGYHNYGGVHTVLENMKDKNKINPERLGFYYRVKKK